METVNHNNPRDPSRPPESIESRLARIEARLVQFMRFMGADPNKRYDTHNKERDK